MERAVAHTGVGQSGGGRGSAKWGLVILIAAAGVSLPGLGDLDLWAPDEPRFAQVAEELRSGSHGTAGLVVLHLNDEVYTQKPPLYYWTVAALGALHGQVSEWDARLPSALASIAVVALVLMLGRSLFGPGSAAGLWGGAILLSLFRFAYLSRRANLDILLTLFETTALFAFWQLEANRPGVGSPRGRRAAFVALHGSIGLALLIKGPVGLLPYGIIAIYLAWNGRFRQISRYLSPSGLALSLGPVLLWMATAIALTPAGFFQEAIVDNVFGRFLTGTSHIRPFYYYAYQFPLDLLPWSLVALPALAAALRGSRSQARDPRPWRLLLIWVGLPVVFFSLSAGKRGNYLLPVFPAVALLTGAWLDQAISHKPRLGLFGVVLAGLTLPFASAGVWLVIRDGYVLPGYPDFPITAGFGLALVAIAATALGLALTPPRARGPAQASRLLGLVIACLIAAEIALFQGLFPSFDLAKSPRPIAEAAAAVTPVSEPVGIVFNRALIAGIAYYTDRGVVEISDPESLRAFIESGGKTLVVRARDHAAMSRSVREASQAESHLKQHSTLRGGSRELRIVRVQPRVDSS